MPILPSQAAARARTAVGALPTQASARAHAVQAARAAAAPIPAKVVRHEAPRPPSKPLNGLGWNHDTYPKSGGLGGFFSQDGFGTGVLVGVAAVMLAGMFGLLPGNKR